MDNSKLLDRPSPQLVSDRIAQTLSLTGIQVRSIVSLQGYPELSTIDLLLLGALLFEITHPTIYSPLPAPRSPLPRHRHPIDRPNNHRIDFQAI